MCFGSGDQFQKAASDSNRRQKQHLCRQRMWDWWRTQTCQICLSLAIKRCQRLLPLALENHHPHQHRHLQHLLLPQFRMQRSPHRPPKLSQQRAMRGRMLLISMQAWMFCVPWRRKKALFLVIRKTSWSMRWNASTSSRRMQSTWGLLPRHSMGLAGPSIRLSQPVGGQFLQTLTWSSNLQHFVDSCHVCEFAHWFNCVVFLKCDWFMQAPFVSTHLGLADTWTRSLSVQQTYQNSSPPGLMSSQRIWTMRMPEKAWLAHCWSVSWRPRIPRSWNMSWSPTPLKWSSRSRIIHICVMTQVDNQFDCHEFNAHPSQAVISFFLLFFCCKPLQLGFSCLCCLAMRC